MTQSDSREIDEKLMFVLIKYSYHKHYSSHRRRKCVLVTMLFIRNSNRLRGNPCRDEAATNWHQQGVPPRIDRELVGAAEPVQPKRPTNATAADSSAASPKVMCHM